MKTPSKKYNIYMINQGLEGICDHILTHSSVDKWMIITDNQVGDLYLDKFVKGLEGKDLSVHIIQAGEGSKSLRSAEEIYKDLSRNQFTRVDGIIALGGGVVGDLAGFVAATYLRGLAWIQVPTSLLAQVDSSVGGKVAVNTDFGKNLVGAFYHPDAVYIDTEFLETLSPRELKSGFGEVIKYACIDSNVLFSKLSAGNLSNLDWPDIVQTCIRIKQVFVEEDEREAGLRKHLNFGHTLGHALEKYHDYKTINHGEAVVQGIYYAGWLSHRLGYLTRESLDLIEGLLRQYGYDKYLTYPVDPIYQALCQDKKRRGDQVDFVLLEELGKSLIQALTLVHLYAYLKEGLQ